MPARTLKAGGRTKADLKIVDLGGGPFVVKDFRFKPWWMRPFGRLQVSRECRAYRWLGPLPGLAGFLGRIDSHALAVEWIDGEPLYLSPRRTEQGPALWQALRATIERFHAAGLYHLDLRGRENVLLRADGRVVVVDLASAVWLRPDGRLRRWLAPPLELADRAAILKWKRLLDAGPYTVEELAFLRRHRFWRALWPFNPKRPGKDRRGRA